MDFKCKCGSESFFIQSKGSQIGLYCSVCGKWQKWLTKDEVRQLSTRRIHWTQKETILKETILMMIFMKNSP